MAQANGIGWLVIAAVVPPLAMLAYVLWRTLR
jgi:hypothetical protein